ncbi:hypothetical protein ShzoTeo12_55540 (plasmid) [Shinella zoogloeoides]|nr:hypothetical protein ShzoTeo12_55540 [Shinella zoogloeoides]
MTACLRITGRAEVSNFAAYHQLLNRARWNPRTLAARLLSVIVARLVPEDPVVIGMDDTIERRWGQRITARGIYRDRLANSALHIIAIGRLRTDEKTKQYVARRVAAGHSKLDAIRALKRYIAREVFGIIIRRQKEVNQTRIVA